MKQIFPPVSPPAFHPSLSEKPLEMRLKLPDGFMVGQVCPSNADLDGYCRTNFGKPWSTLRSAALRDLSTRLAPMSSRIELLERLLRAGQPAETLIEAYDAIKEACRR